MMQIYSQIFLFIRQALVVFEITYLLAAAAIARAFFF